MIKKRIELRSYHNVNGMLEKPILWDVNTSRQFREQNRKYPVYRMIYGIKYIEQRRAILSLSSWKFPTIHDRVYKYSGSSCVSFSRRHQILLVSCFLSLCALIYVYGRLSPSYPQ